MTILEYGVCALHSLAISRPRTQSLDYQRERYSADAARVLRTSRIVLHPEKIELLQNTRMIYMSACLGTYAGTLLNRDSGQSDCTSPRGDPSASDCVMSALVPLRNISRRMLLRPHILVVNETLDVQILSLPFCVMTPARLGFEPVSL